MLRRLWLILVCLITSSLVATATVCAQENVVGAEISCGGTVHAEGDDDLVPADADRGMPHHHGSCHGHAFAIDTLATALPAPSLTRLAPLAHPDSNAISRAIGPALRPPQS